MEYRLARGYVPGAIGRVTELHGRYYHEQWGFGQVFESMIATELAEFLGRYDEHRDGFWTASRDGRVEGSITVDGIHANREGAHLRWFIVSDALRGSGVGARLMHAAIEFCRERRYSRAYLWTFEGLDPARALYEKAGFKLTRSEPGETWGRKVVEQRFEWSA